MGVLMPEPKDATPRKKRPRAPRPAAEEQPEQTPARTDAKAAELAETLAQERAAAKKTKQAAATRVSRLRRRVQDLELDAEGINELLEHLHLELEKSRAAAPRDRPALEEQMAQAQEHARAMESERNTLDAAWREKSEELRRHMMARAAADQDELAARLAQAEAHARTAAAEAAAAWEEATRISTEAGKQEQALLARIAEAESHIRRSATEQETTIGELTREKERSRALQTTGQEEQAGLRAHLERAERMAAAAKDDVHRLRRELTEEASQLAAVKTERREAERALRAYIEALEDDSTADDETRFLRIDDGTVYGPVAPTDLCTWVADGRIDPGHGVSNDGQVWRPAKDIPELGMAWKVQLVDGTVYGPLHPSAVRHLMADGAVSADAQLIHAQTGTTQTLDELPNLEAEAWRQEHQRLADALSKKNRRLKAERLRGENRERPTTSQGRAPTLPPKLIRRHLAAPQSTIPADDRAPS